MPYLPIDPKDIGRSYEAIIRINSQSGKGGVAYVLETEHGIQMPKAMHVELGKVINDLADQYGTELTPQQIWQTFQQTYLRTDRPFRLESFRATASHEGEGASTVQCMARVAVDGVSHELRAAGNGPINAFVNAMKEELVADCNIVSYAEHSLGEGSRAEAIAYIQIRTLSGATFFGAATDTNIELASIKAVLCALNGAMRVHSQHSQAGNQKVGSEARDNKRVRPKCRSRWHLALPVLNPGASTTSKGYFILINSGNWQQALLRPPGDCSPGYSSANPNSRQNP